MAENPVPPNATALQVKQVLATITSLQEWKNDDYWSFFIKGRTQILDAVFKEVSGKDWQNPITAKQVDTQFIRRAKERWQGKDDEWIMRGEWLDNRPDIVAWFRARYWKDNKKRITSGEGGPQYAQDKNSQDAGINEVQPEGGNASKSWKSVVGL